MYHGLARPHPAGATIARAGLTREGCFTLSVHLQQLQRDPQRISWTDATDATDTRSEEPYQTWLLAGNAENLHLPYAPRVLLVYADSEDV